MPIKIYSIFKRFFIRQIRGVIKKHLLLTLPLNIHKNNIDYKANDNDLADCIKIVKRTWLKLGITKPHFSVLTETKYLPNRLNSQNVKTFYESGEAESKEIISILSNFNFNNLNSKSCVEFGCGVGRVTLSLAKVFRNVTAYDISENHIQIAKNMAETVKLSNIGFRICADNIIEPIEKCDFYYSKIVFQHNPPPIIYLLIRNALISLNPDGIAIFQVPVYAVGYNFSLIEWINTEHLLDMQMHCLPQDAIFSLINDENCRLLQVREDNATGAPDIFISNTFIVKKQ